MWARRGRMMAWQWLSMALLGMAPAVLHAEGEHYSLVYRAPDSCPTAAEFAHRVLARTAHASHFLVAEGDRPVIITIEGEGGRFVGTLTLRVGDGETTERQVQGDDCAEVFAALVVVTSLALDAQDPLAREPLLVGAAVAESSPRQEPSDPAAIAGSPPAPSVSPHEPARRARSPSGHLGLGIVGTTGFAPRPAFGGRLLGEVDLASHQSVLAELGYATAGRAELAGEEATFGLVDATVGWCAVVRSARLRLASPCLGLDLGVLRSRGQSSPAIARPETSDTAWVGLGLGARASLALGARTLLVIGGDVTLALTRPVFVAELPERKELFAPPPGGLRFLLGVAIGDKSPSGNPIRDPAAVPAAW